MKKILIINILLLLVIPIAYASWGVGYPTKLELKNGESGRFKFSIDANQHPEDMECTYGIPSINGLIIEYDQNKTIVNANTIGHVMGTVIVSDDIEGGSYTDRFCISCNKIVKEGSGTSLKANYCGIPLTVNVVSERTRENTYVPEKPKLLEKPKFPISTTIIITAIIIIVILIIIIEKKKILKQDKNYYYKKKRKGEKKKKR